MEIQFTYLLITLVFGMGATALLYQLSVVKNFKLNEANLKQQFEKLSDELSFERGIKEELSSAYAATKRDLVYAQTKLEEQKGELQHLNEHSPKILKTSPTK